MKKPLALLLAVLMASTLLLTSCGSKPVEEQTPVQKEEETTTNTETKEEVKEEPKEDLKEEVKEEPKKEVKEEPKEEIVVPAVQLTPLVTEGFDEQNVVVTFGAFADVHVFPDGDKNDYTNDRLDAALKFLTAGTDNGLDAIVISGDLTELGAFKEVSALTKIVNAELGEQMIPVLFSTGNHDKITVGMAASVERKLYDEAFAADIDTGKMAAECRHSVVGGVHFIQVSANAYKPNVVHYNNQTMEWLKNSLEIAAKDSPDMPIFVSTHLPVYGTVFGSDAFFEKYAETWAWASKDLEELLNQYPQVVLLSGHTHYPQHAENTILQDGFTMINVGTLNYIVVDDMFTNEAAIPTGAADVPSGMLIEVDAHGAVRIRRFDYNKMAEIGSPWVLSAPGSETALKDYDASRAEKVNTFPVKDLAAEVSGGGTMRKAKLTFSSADSSENRVYFYQVDIKAANSTEVVSQKYLTDFYLALQPEDMKASWEIEIEGLTIGTTYEITVTPYSVWEAAGESQTVSVDLGNA